MFKISRTFEKNTCLRGLLDRNMEMKTTALSRYSPVEAFRPRFVGREDNLHREVFLLLGGPERLVDTTFDLEKVLRIFDWYDLASTREL